MKDFAISLLEQNGEMRLYDLQRALLDHFEDEDIKAVIAFTRKLRTEGVVSYRRVKKNFMVTLEKASADSSTEGKEDTEREQAVKWLYQESGIFDGAEIVIDHTADPLGKAKWSLLIALSKQGKLEQVFREPLEEL